MAIRSEVRIIDMKGQHNPSDLRTSRLELTKVYVTPKIRAAKDVLAVGLFNELLLTDQKWYWSI